MKGPPCTSNTTPLPVYFCYSFTKCSDLIPTGEVVRRMGTSLALGRTRHNNSPAIEAFRTAAVSELLGGEERRFAPSAGEDLDREGSRMAHRSGPVGTICRTSCLQRPIPRTGDPDAASTSSHNVLNDAGCTFCASSPRPIIRGLRAPEPFSSPLFAFPRSPITNNGPVPRTTRGIVPSPGDHGTTPSRII